MNIVVCVKHVPDAQADRTFSEDHTVDVKFGTDDLAALFEPLPG